MLSLPALSKALLGEIFSGVDKFLGLSRSYQMIGQMACHGLIHKNGGLWNKVILNDELLRVDKV